MIDEKDNKTADLFDDKPARRGRPRQYASNAERQRAYRQRQKAKGLRERKRWTRTIKKEEELKSDIIDLTSSLGAAIAEQKTHEN